MLVGDFPAAILKPDVWNRLRLLIWFHVSGLRGSHRRFQRVAKGFIKGFYRFRVFEKFAQTVGSGGVIFPLVVVAFVLQIINLCGVSVRVERLNGLGGTLRKPGERFAV